MSTSPLLPTRADININSADEEQGQQYGTQQFLTNSDKLNALSFSIISSFFNLCCFPALCLSLTSIYYACKALESDENCNYRIAKALILISISVSLIFYIGFAIILYGLLKPL